MTKKVWRELILLTNMKKQCCCAAGVPRPRTTCHRPATIIYGRSYGLLLLLCSVAPPWPSQGIMCLFKAASAHSSCCKKSSSSSLAGCLDSKAGWCIEISYLPHLLPQAPSLHITQPVGNFALLDRKTNLCSWSQASGFCWPVFKSLFEVLSQTKDLIHFC